MIMNRWWLFWCLFLTLFKKDVYKRQAINYLYALSVSVSLLHIYNKSAIWNFANWLMGHPVQCGTHWKNYIQYVRYKISETSSYYKDFWLSTFKLAGSIVELKLDSTWKILPSYCGITGNRRAGELAKKGTAMFWI